MIVHTPGEGSYIYHVSIKLYVDESGNTGSDLYDLKQPVFTYAATWLDESQRQHFTSYLSDLRTNHQIQGTGELKGKTLLNSRRGRSAIRAVFEELKARKIPLLLTMVHKPFMAAGVIVEDCTDYAYNSAFTEQWTWNTRLKEPLAEQIFQNTDSSLLSRTWRARDGDDEAAFKETYATVLGRLALHPNDHLARLAQLMLRADLSELWSVSQGARTVGPQYTGSGYSPNLAAFSPLLWTADEQAEGLGHNDVEIVHDQQSQFNALFTYWWNVLRNAAPADERLPNGNRMRLPIRNLTGITFADSATEAGIQISDILASALRVLLQEALSKQLDRSRDFAEALKALCRERELLGSSPLIVGPESWQLATWDLLVGLPSQFIRS